MKKYPKIGIRPTIDGRQGGVRESLEEKTMNLAKAVAELISSNLKNGDGSPVECVIADNTIGRVAESAACAEKFEREGVGSTITVTSCWCYGAETMDMNPHYPKAVWGFNGTERPGAVYLAAVLAGHAQKGLPAFGIYGRDVQDLDDNTIPEDVAEKILRFARAAQAVATMRGKSYLSMGSVSMGIAGSIVNPDFFQEYLGMRNESIDLTEIIRRMEEGIYDHEEYTKAMAWTEKYCKVNEGEDFKNRPEKRKNREQKDADWEFVVKMMIIMRDLMTGNPKLKEMGFKEEALGHNAIAAGFQGQRQWTDFYPNGDYPEALLNTSFDWNGIREAFVVATENDACNGVAMLFGHLLTNRAQIFSDVRTYWSPEAVKRVTGKELTGLAANGIIHLINSGATTLDGSGQSLDAEGNPVMKEPWNLTDADVENCLKATTWYPADRDYFRGGGFSSNFLSKGGMPVTMMRLNLIKGLGPVLQIAEGWTVEIDPEIHQKLNMRTDPTWPTTWFVPRLCDKSAFKDVYSVMNNWGANHGAISYGHIGIYDHEEYTKAMAWTEKYCKVNEGEDFKNRPEKRKNREQKDADWEFVVKMMIIMRDLMTGNPKLKEMGFKEEALGHNAIAAGFQGQRQWTDFYPNGDYPEALLNTSFDWNGIREAFVVATENDACNGVAMLFGHLLTNRAQIFSDVRTYWSPEAVKRVTGKELTGLAANGIIHLINSGATTLDGSGQSLDAEGNPVMKEPWNLTDADVENCLKATTWYPADRDYFRGGGFSSNFLSKGGMPVTMMRLNLIKGLGPVLQIAEGWTVEIDPEIHQKLNMRTDPTWPTTWFVPRLCDKSAFKDVYSVMNNWGANHGAISYGHIGQDLITLASMLRIPVCMHNVDENEIFRPAAWNAFGMDKEGADYRACTTYGPIYK